jgi:hypothetical protein
MLVFLGALLPFFTARLSRLCGASLKTQGSQMKNIFSFLSKENVKKVNSAFSAPL